MAIVFIILVLLTVFTYTPLAIYSEGVDYGIYIFGFNRINVIYCNWIYSDFRL